MLVKILSAEELIKLGYKLDNGINSYTNKDKYTYYCLNKDYVIGRITHVIKNWIIDSHPFYSPQLNYAFAEHQFKVIDSKLAKLLYGQ